MRRALTEPGQPAHGKAGAVAGQQRGSDQRSLSQVNADLLLVIAERDHALLEMRHRVKNNLQLIMSLLNLQAAKLRDLPAQEGLRQLADQIIAIAMVHDELTIAQGPEVVDYCISLRVLCRKLGNAYRSLVHIEVEIGVDDCTVPVRTAVHLSLIVNELISNAFKHAFPDGRAGSVLVRLHAANGINRLTVGDDGVGIDGERVDRTGYQLIGMLSKSIGGEVSCRSDRLGTRVELSFPVMQAA